ncbi:hypothetical protein PoB_004958400 [Plakobranchus ocellatus]|uniref:Uncharacterized protein n=1 Tax=Plakobranchus ocellatus TaxID=259542 RepID=A0AAV4BW89_9GAST|nr:hypothetical protein PoB_004958400 [Plakobranchus ocellatus]
MREGAAKKRRGDGGRCVKEQQRSAEETAENAWGRSKEAQRRRRRMTRGDHKEAWAGRGDVRRYGKGRAEEIGEDLHSRTD